MIKKLGTEIRVERLRLNISTKKIIEKLQITKQQLYYLERKEDYLSIIKYLFFLRANGIDINELFDGVIDSNEEFSNYKLKSHKK